MLRNAWITATIEQYVHTYEVDLLSSYLEMGGWIPLLSVNKAWEQCWITDEEYGSVVSHHIPDAFFGVEFYSEATRISERNESTINIVSCIE